MKITAIRLLALSAFLVTTVAANAQDHVFIRGTFYDGSFLGGAKSGTDPDAWLPVSALSFNAEQTLNIGSQSTGAGAGKVTFNPLSFVMLPGSVDAKLFQMAASGTPFKTLEVRVDHGSAVAEVFILGLAAVKTISWFIDSSGQLQNKLAFEYGRLAIVIPKPGTGLPVPATSTTWTGQLAGGWNRITNVAISALANVAQ